MPELETSAQVRFSDATVPLLLSAEVPGELTTEQVEAALSAAVGTWGGPECSGLELDYQGTTSKSAAPGDGVNTIQWVSNWTTRGLPAEAAGATDTQYAQVNDGGWYIAEADIYLNLDYAWSTEQVEDTRDVQAVLTHELGHLLGLLHSCEQQGAGGAPDCADVPGAGSTTMYPIYSPGQSALSSDDVDGLCFLYTATCDDSSCAESEVCGDDGACHALCGDTGDWCRPGTICDGESCLPVPANCGSEGCVGNQCTEDHDCARHEFCVKGECARGDAALGDPCGQAQECFDGACVDGSCALSCVLADDCPGSATCDRTSGACVTELKPMGSTCDAPSECRGNRCLGVEGREPTCTRSCDTGQPLCPNDWHCRTVEDEPVCVPDRPASDGCSLGSTPSSHSFATGGSALLALLLLAGSRRVSARGKSSP